MEKPEIKESDKGRSERLLKVALWNDKAVFQLMNSIEKLGCEIPHDSFFRLRPCEGAISGGFNIEQDDNKSKSTSKYIPNIVICDNKSLEAETFTNTLIHELVHAYDVCRVKSFKVDNCKYHACTEIRASALSGECSLLHEFWRGNFKVQNGHSDCVKRRATLSLGMNPACKVYSHIVVYSRVTMYI